MPLLLCQFRRHRGAEEAKLAVGLERLVKSLDNCWR